MGLMECDCGKMLGQLFCPLCRMTDKRDNG